MARRRPQTWESVRTLALRLPGIEEGTAYGSPALPVRGRFLARLRDDNAWLEPGAQGPVATDGPHRAGGGCISFRRLDEVHIPTLRRLIVASVRETRRRHR